MKRKPSLQKHKLTNLDQNFWSRFANKFWERKPLVLKNVNSELIQMDAQAIFDLLVLYSNHCRKINSPDGFKFYINGMQTYQEEVLQVLPLKKDKNLLGYHCRMQTLFSDYCLVCDELLKTNSVNLAMLTDFTNELYRHVGFPNRFSEMGLYLGNYRKTPFGVHVDSCGVFSFPVSGTKNFRIWTTEYVQKHPDLNRTFKYAKHKLNSQLLQVNPGDMAYWPSSAWHIAESDGSFSATWSLGVWVDKLHNENFSQVLAELLAQRMGASGLKATTLFKNLHDSNGQVHEIRPGHSQSIELMQSLNTAEINEAVLKAWMVHISKQGFKDIPHFEFDLKMTTQISLRNNRHPILWQQGQIQKNKIYISYAGFLIESDKASGIFQLIKDINSGKSSKISDYLKGKNKVKEFSDLQSLAKAGAFV